MGNLNKKAYESSFDNLISDIKHQVDVRAIPVTLTPGSAGVIKRGQVIDLDEGACKLHTSGGTANCIVAEDTEYGESDSTVTCAVYITGDFNKSAIISDVEITDSDIERLRGLGIFIK